MKRLIMFSVLTLAVVALAVATGSTEQAGASQNAPVTINWLAYNTYAQPDPTLSAPVMQYMEQRYNAKFNVEYIDDQQWDQAFAVKIAGGDIPDFFKIKTLNLLKTYVDQGVLGEMTPAITDKIPAYMKTIAQFDSTDNWKIPVTVDGKLYAIRKILPQGAYPLVMVWRGDWLKAVGINKVPDTLAEFEDAIYKLTFNDPDGNGKNDTYGLSSRGIVAVLGAFGKPPIDMDFKSGNLAFEYADGKFTLSNNDPAMADALTLLNKWYKDGVIDPEFITGENKGGYWAVSHSFINGRIGVTGGVQGYHWQPPLSDGMAPGAVLKAYLDLHPDAEIGKDLWIGPTPLGPNGKSGYQNWASVAEGYGFSDTAVLDPAKVNVITSVVNDWYGDFNYWVRDYYGVEGQTYKIDENGVYVSTLPAGTQPASYGLTVFALEQPLFQKETEKPLWDWRDKYQFRGYPSVDLPPSEAYQTFSGDLKKLTVETYLKMILGDVPVSDFSKFATQFDKNGGEAILSEIN